MRLARFFLALCLVAAATAPARATEGHGGGAAQEQAPASRQERLTSADTYLPMPTLSAGVIQRQTNRGTLVVDMGLDIPDADLRRHAQFNAPRLRDALRTALATYASTYYRDRTAPDPTTLTRIMQQSIDRTLGAAGAQVLLVNIIFQRGQQHG
jgi:hypothetical protein